MNTSCTIQADPYNIECDPDHTALLIIDMQRDFVQPGGFGEHLGNDVEPLQEVIEPISRLLDAARECGMTVIHTREGHDPNLADCPENKLQRGNLDIGIGDEGPMGRVLVRGEEGHGIIDELAPISGETVIDKPGKGSFYATDLDLRLREADIETLFVVGVTAEVCVHSTVREANDRGYNCIVVEDCVGSYFDEFRDVGLQMIKAQGGIFGWVSELDAVLDALPVDAPT